MDAIGGLAGAEVSWAAHAMPALYTSYAGARRAWTAMASTKSKAHRVVNELAAYAKYAVALTTFLVLLREVLAGLGLQLLSCRKLFPVQAAFVALMLLMYMDFSFLIPIGYDLASAMEGNGAASSGWLISFNNAGVLLGSGLGFVLCKVLHHRSKKRIVVAALCACALVYTRLAAALLSCSSGPAGGGCALTFEVMLGARMLAGFLQGVTIMYAILARELTPEEQQVSLSMWENFSLSGGVCFGPFAFSLTVLMVGGGDGLGAGGGALSAFDKMAAASCTFAILFAALAATISVVTPHDVSALERRGGACAGEAPAGPGMSLHGRSKLWALGLVIMFLGALGYSAVEAGSSLLLETSFGWKPDAIGFALACSFGVAAVVSVSLNETRELLFSDLQALVGLSGLGILGSLCFLDVGPGSAARILAGDCMLYPGLLTVNGLLEGYLYILAWPGTWFSTDCTVLASQLLDQAGRFLAIPLTRGMLEHAGQTPYALSQGALICLVACLGCLLVRAMEHSASFCGPHADKPSPT